MVAHTPSTSSASVVTSYHSHRLVVIGKYGSTLERVAASGGGRRQRHLDVFELRRLKLFGVTWRGGKKVQK